MRLCMISNIPQMDAPYDQISGLEGQGVPDERVPAARVNFQCRDVFVVALFVATSNRWVGSAAMSASKNTWRAPVRKWFRDDNLTGLHQRIRSRGEPPAKMEIRASWS
jgi:hypothetical protein